MKQLPVSLLVKSILYDAVLQGLYLPDAACTHSLDLDVITLIVLLFCSDPRCLVFGDGAAVPHDEHHPDYDYDPFPEEVTGSERLHR